MDRRVSARSKFTRGEKCIFTHLILTYCVIFVSVMIYLVHLYVVGHNVGTAFSTRRRASNYHSIRLDAVPIGMIYLDRTPERRTCNTLLLRRSWSLGPGHCIALMSHPDLSHLLLDWRIKYRYNAGVKITRTVVHPHFDTDTFENNIGVVQHKEVIRLREYNLPMVNYGELNSRMDSENKLIIVTWLEEAKLSEDGQNGIGKFPAELLSQGNCKVEMAPIVDIRSYETCAVFENAVYAAVGHGALALEMNSLEVVGIFAWGEKLHRGFPLVIINLTYYQEWVEVAMTL